MKRLFYFVFACTMLVAASCTKDTFITGKDAFIITSDTALHFDTLFTATGSVTKVLKIFNINDQKLRISNLQLGGGNHSFFKMNVSGTPGTDFTNIDIEAGDSLYVFVMVNVAADNRQLPFFIEDSISISYNGNKQIIKLDGYGQNARFLKNVSVTRDTTWTNDLPIVLLDSFSVTEDNTLTLEQGVRVYCHANTPLYIFGTLKANGSADSAGHIIFQNDRLDAPYSKQPGTWQGIYFSAGSTGNILSYTTIKNAQQGVAADNESGVTLNECVVDNCSNEGIITYNSNFKATNCLISNCSYDVYVTGGGNYTFTNCTMVTYNTTYLYHQYPVLSLSNASFDATESNPLMAVVRNCIIYGDAGIEEDEIAVNNQPTNSSSIHFENTLYKSSAENTAIDYTNCLPLQDPLFTSVNILNNVFDFHILPGSPCMDAGLQTPVNTDLDGNKRDEQPDIGCYEIKK